MKNTSIFSKLNFIRTNADRNLLKDLPGYLFPTKLQKNFISLVFNYSDKYSHKNEPTPVQAGRIFPCQFADIRDDIKMVIYVAELSPIPLEEQDVS